MKKLIDLETEESKIGTPLDKDLEAIRSAVWRLCDRGYNIEEIPEFVNNYVNYILKETK